MKGLRCIVCNNKFSQKNKDLPAYLLCRTCSTLRIKKIKYREYDQNYYQGKFRLVSNFFSPLFKFFYWYRTKYCSYRKGLWIDVGAGSGEYLATLPSKNKIGVEKSAYGRKQMLQQKIKVLTQSQFLKTHDLHAKVISFWHVLEHVENPDQYLESARRNLSSNGQIIIGIPNTDSLEFRIFKTCWFHLDSQHHVWHFPLSSFQDLLKKKGFKIEKIDYWAPEHHLSGVLQSFINFTSNSNNVLHKLIKRDYGAKLSFSSLLWSLFWLSIGFPIVLLFWIVESLTKKSGAVVIISSTNEVTTGKSAHSRLHPKGGYR